MASKIEDVTFSWPSKNRFEIRDGETGTVAITFKRNKDGTVLMLFGAALTSVSGHILPPEGGEPVAFAIGEAAADAD